MKIKINPPMHIEKAMKKFDPVQYEFIFDTNNYPKVIAVEKKSMEKMALSGGTMIPLDIANSILGDDLKKQWVMADENNLVYVEDKGSVADAYKKYIKSLDAVYKKSNENFPFPIARRIARAAARFDLNLELPESFSIRQNSTVHSAYRYDIHDIGVVPEYFLRNGIVNVGGIFLDEFSKTLVHEFGHAVWHRILTDEEHAQYQKLIPEFLKPEEAADAATDGKPVVRGKAYSITGEMGYSELSTIEDAPFVSTYARYSPKEDFAESYLYYKVVPNELLKLSPERYEFIKNADAKASEYSVVSKQEEIVTMPNEDKFAVIEQLPVDLQMNPYRRDMAKMFKFGLDKLLSEQELKDNDVKYIIPIGEFSTKVEYPENINVLVYIPSLKGAMQITDHRCKIICLNNKLDFEKLAYQHKYVDVPSEERMRKGGPGSGRLWLPKNQIERWVTTDGGKHIPIPKKKFEGQPKELPMGYAEPKARVSHYHLEKPQQTKMIVQEHHAERAGKHYDLRLAMDDKAYSWAVPRGLPAPGGKSLAILQPPHTKEYMNFQGQIESGYGKGYVKQFANEDVDITDWSHGTKKFRIHSGPNAGHYALVKSRIPFSKKWLLVRGSVRKPLLEQHKLARARMNIRPYMWEHDNYVVQPKFDGSRYAMYVGKDENRLLSRKKSKRGGGFVERTDNLPYLRDLKIAAPDSVIDGEIFIKDFDTTQRIMGSSPMRSRQLQEKLGKPAYVVFDVLKYKGKDIKSLPYEIRLKYAKKIVDEANSKDIQLIPTIHKDKLKYAKHLIKTGWEGAVVKDLKSPYYGAFMSKFKRFRTGDYVITGSQPGKGKYEGLVGAINIAEVGPGGKLIPRGKVGTGLSVEQRKELTANIDNLVTNKAVVEVKMLTKTKRGTPRAPVFMRLREDKHWRQANG